MKNEIKTLRRCPKCGETRKLNSERDVKGNTFCGRCGYCARHYEFNLHLSKPTVDKKDILTYLKKRRSRLDIYLNNTLNEELTKEHDTEQEYLNTLIKLVEEKL